MRSIVVASAVFAGVASVACGSPPQPVQPVAPTAAPIGSPNATLRPEHARVIVPGGSAGAVEGTIVAMPNGKPAGASSPTSPSGSPGAPVVSCPVPTCAFHAGAAGYFTCLAGGAGSCFHFGAPCTPTDGCMFDPNARTYKACAHAVEGVCEKWGAGCVPASRCMFDPRDGLHRHCDDAAADGCHKWGALCAP